MKNELNILKNYQYYDLANSLNLIIINNNHDSNSQTSVKQSNLFLSDSKYSSFLVDGGDISKLISGFLTIEMTKLFFKLNYSNVLMNDEG